jgi:hypothetical protein
LNVRTTPTRRSPRRVRQPPDTGNPAKRGRSHASVPTRDRGNAPRLTAYFFLERFLLLRRHFYRGPVMADLPPFHALAEIFPLMQEEALAALAEDIDRYGQRVPAISYEDKVLEGRNRAIACHRLNKDLWIVPYEGDDPLSVVISLNDRRRHLMPGQRAMAAAMIADMRQGERTDLPSHEGKLSQAAAAKIMNVSVASVERAAVVRKHGDPELIARVQNGGLSAKQAAEIVRRRNEGTSVKQAVKEVTRSAPLTSSAEPTAIIPAPQIVEALRTLGEYRTSSRETAREFAERVAVMMQASCDQEIYRLIDSASRLLAEFRKAWRQREKYRREAADCSSQAE